MDGTRGAWRRGPLPGALTRTRPATMTADLPWSEPAEPRRAPDQLMASATEEAQVRQGGCLCGAVRYEARGAPTVVGLCHCADCRKATGGFAMPYADWPLAAVTITGALSTFAGRSFCPGCGSRVAHLGSDQAEIILGTLDDPPGDMVPTREIWTIRREPWMQPVPGADQFERDAP